jgi:hypothetical protein
LNLKCDFPVSKFAFKCNLYHYIKYGSQRGAGGAVGGRGGSSHAAASQRRVAAAARSPGAASATAAAGGGGAQPPKKETPMERMVGLYSCCVQFIHLSFKAPGFQP